MLYFFVAWLRWRGVAIGAMVVAVVLTTAWLVPGSAVRDRFATAIDEYRMHVPMQTTNNSIGNRIEFYRAGVEIFLEHPLTGVGTGGFPAADAARVAGTPRQATTNPHNEYLLIATQFGAGGLVLFVGMFVLRWFAAARIPDSLERHLARGLVIAFASASMVSSTLMDHVEGLLFVWLTALLHAQSVRNPATKQP